MFRTVPLNGPFGVDILDIDISQRPNEPTGLALVNALMEHRVLRVRNQHLKSADIASMGPLWGQPILYFDAEDRDPEFHELIHVTNSTKVPARKRDVAASWHTDASYDAYPATVTMLYAVEAPQHGGETLFIDMVSAYDDLAPALREQIDGLQVLHRIPSAERFRDDTQKQDANKADIEYKSQILHGVQSHPLVLRNPITGRHSLYSVWGSSYGIVGKTADESEEVLSDLRNHVVQTKYRMDVKAHSGDLLIWDNLSTQHSAVPIEYSDEDGKRRRLMRLSTRGLPQPYANLSSPFMQR